MLTNSVEGFLAYVMFYVAGVFQCSFLGDSNTHEEFCEDFVSGVDACCNFKAFFCESDEPV